MIILVIIGINLHLMSDETSFHPNSNCNYSTVTVPISNAKCI